MALYHADFLFFGTKGNRPRCRYPPLRSDQITAKKSERRKINIEITIKINGRMVSVEVSGDVSEWRDQSRRKAENLDHERRRHWDNREFDEYIVATEGLLPYQPTPEDIVCQRETLELLLSILDTHSLHYTQSV